MKSDCDKKNPDCIEWMAKADVILGSMKEKQESIESFITDIHKSIVGNGIPGLKERISKIEWRHKIVMGIFKWGATALSGITVAMVTYFLCRG